METILITGANRGIGLALTQTFLNGNDRVVATARHPNTATALQELSRTEQGQRLTILQMDVTQPDSVQRAGLALRYGWNELDVLINNAGVYPEGGDEDIVNLAPATFTEAFQVNVVGVVCVCQAFLPMLAQGNRPRLINLSSGAASISTRDDHRRYCYGSSKAALNHLTRGLAAELGKKNITVVAMSPGWVKTDMGGPEADLSPEESAQAMVQSIGRLKLDHTSLFLDRNGSPDTYAW